MQEDVTWRFLIWLMVVQQWHVFVKYNSELILNLIENRNRPRCKTTLERRNVLCPMCGLNSQSSDWSRQHCRTFTPHATHKGFLCLVKCRWVGKRGALWLEFIFDIYDHVDGLMQERCNSIANAPELRLSCINPSMWWSRNVTQEDPKVGL